MTKERVDKSMYWLRPDFATALGVSLSKLRAIENKPGFPEFKIVTNPETGTQYKVFNRREAEAFVSQYLDDKATFCTRMAIDFVVTAARPLELRVILGDYPMPTYTQCEHARINAKEYPGTRQLCVRCDQPTGRCEDDSIYLEPEFEHQSSLGPLCEECAAELFWD